MSGYGKSRHYMASNISQHLPVYSNQEQEHIHEAFSSASFKTIQALPNYIHPQSINDSKFQKIGHNLNHNMLGTVLLNKPQGPYFHAFPYESTPYDGASYLLKQELEAHRGSMQKISQTAWKPSHTNPHTAHNPPEPRQPQPGVGLGAGQFYCDPFEDSEDLGRRAMSEDRRIRLAGAFVAGNSSGNAHRVRVSSQQQMSEVQNSLQKVLGSEYGHVLHSVYADEDGFIVIRFHLLQLQDPASVVVFLTGAIASHPLLTKYALIRITAMWNIVVDELQCFSVKPPWVKQQLPPVQIQHHPVTLEEAEMIQGEMKELEKRLDLIRKSREVKIKNK